MIGDFRGAANIGDRRQERVLNHGTQQRVGAEFFGMMFRSLQRFLEGFLDVSGSEAAILRADGDPLAIDDAKYQSAVFGDLDLGVEASAFQRCRSRHKFFCESLVLL